jgi:hypothetical protein
VIRAQWWSCGEETLLRHERGLSANQARRRRCERNFLGGKGLECSGVATEHDLYKTMGNIGVCIEFELLKVKVPSVFLGTVGGTLVVFV